MMTFKTEWEHIRPVPNHQPDDVSYTRPNPRYGFKKSLNEKGEDEKYKHVLSKIDPDSMNGNHQLPVISSFIHMSYYLMIALLTRDFKQTIVWLT